MAKLQKSTLDPSKISGRCGRLKCCLRFEQDVYEEFQKELPPVGSRILTSKGQGRVLAQEILARKLLVEFEDGRRIVVAADEILTRALGEGACRLQIADYRRFEFGKTANCQLCNLQSSTP